MCVLLNISWEIQWASIIRTRMEQYNALFLTQQFLENPNIDNKKAAYMAAFLSFAERILKYLVILLLFL